jgi:aromatic-L-amino-acid/L-tryptophan decarboxylase
MHGVDGFPPGLARRLADHIAQRTAEAPLGRTARRDEFDAGLSSITASGLDADVAWALFRDVVAPVNVGLDSERFLAFIPAAPTPASVWMDAVVSASSFSAESSLEAAGAVAAENEVLRWMCDLVGFPDRAGGCFLSGGTIGNLSALAVGRSVSGGRDVVVVADSAHASIDNSLRLMGLSPLVVSTDADGRLHRRAVADAVAGRADVGIVVASGGSTNAGVVDDLDGIGQVARELDAWFHVDAAYGGAALLVDGTRDLFVGIDRADSVVIDPHKWLFAPLGSGAVLYRDPARAVAVHRQVGPYIDVFHDADAGWNPSDYGMQLTRRATGLPLWFSLVVHGVDAYAAAIEASVVMARRAAELFAAIDGVSVVMPPQLGVVLFRRDGWGRDEWRRWATRLLDDRVAFVAPTTVRGEIVGRLVFLHPGTPFSVVEEIAATLGPDSRS